jgi:UDPglucose 6-dehydrogenase
MQLLGSLKGKKIAIWGLTYKAGTNTLRRSSAIELCQSLLAQGAEVHAHDPSLSSLPQDLSQIQLFATPEEAVEDADALVIATEWPDYKNVKMEYALQRMRNRLVLDANRFLLQEISGLTSNVSYITVGKAT